MESREGKASGRPSSGNVSTKLSRIAELAKEVRGTALTTLAHHIDEEFLGEAYRLTRKDGAAGIDGQMAEAYEKDLEANLQSLLNRFKSGTYHAPPVRRVHIPKADGKQTRPIGIPTLEDKVLQRAASMILEAVYEQEFLRCSYGFRPGRSAHQAIEDLWGSLMRKNGGVVLELDIQKFFDTMDHGHLRTFLDRRVRDGVLRRTIDKWLAAGVFEDGSVHYPETGSPQGGVISPILSNVYLHEVLDRWFESEVKPRLRGKADLIRYADDAVMVFEREEDAKRVMAILPQRFAKYGLTLHPEKTRLVRFSKPRGPDGSGGGTGSFDFLGFTHYWGTSRRGTQVVKRKTAGSRVVRALKSIGTWLRQNLHLGVVDQFLGLARKLEGHFAYYGITGNYGALSTFRHRVTRLWHEWLNRQGQRARWTWEKLTAFLSVFELPRARIVHSVLRA
jgi:group II intron reverse transcriptase/maturase